MDLEQVEQIGADRVSEGLPKVQWYAAHLVFGFFFVDGSNGGLHENIFLLASDESDAVFKKAELLGLSQAAQEGWRVDDKPAEYRFVGVKRIVTCEEVPGDGVEVSYLSISLPDGVTPESYLRAEDAEIIYHSV